MILFSVKILKCIKEVMEEMNKNTLFEELKFKELEELEELDQEKITEVKGKDD